MVKMKHVLLLLLFPLSLQAQWRDNEWSKVDGYDVVEYTERIVGKFATTTQHKEEPYFDDVTVETFWIRDDMEGIWLYTEQSNTGDSIPYRQRVYNIVWLNDTTIVSKVYRLKNPKQVEYPQSKSFLRGGPTFYELLARIKRSDLIHMEGCDTNIHKGIDGNYYGSTDAEECKGSYMGANYTTSQFRVYPHMVVSWEQGWKNDGEQVWGSSRGYYYYRKIEDGEAYNPTYD
jgi:CpeT protein